MSGTVAGRKGRSAAISIGLAALVASAVGLAWAGAEPLRGETTQGGVFIRTLSEGDGAPIGMQDGVMIEYEGRLPDGTVFDSTEGRGPAPLLVGGTIPGFAEALMQMRKGGSYTIRIPAALAYGASPPPGSPIPANADLSFDVEVVEVVPNAAALAGQVPPGEAPPPQPQR